jgi:DNA-binding XRE family transcriptional regulator
MEQKWLRLGRALAQARKQASLTQNGVADAIGVTRSPIQAIERGDEVAKVTGTMRSYARLVGWTDDSIDAVLAGGEPTHLRVEDLEREGAQVRTGADDLPLRIIDELGEGQLLDTTVLDLTPGGSGARMIVVVRGAPEASAEEIRRDLMAWRRAQRHLQNLGDAGDDEPPAQAADQA